MTDRQAPETVEDFITYWRESSGSERANYQLFLSELCRVLDLPVPEGTKKNKALDTYVFDRGVRNPVSNQTQFIDLYRAGCFVLETKQGVDKAEAPKDIRQFELDTGRTYHAPEGTGHGIRGSKGWRRTMDKALTQARGYARHIEAETGAAPPFVIVVDIGYQFEVFADFSGRGTNYTLFPNPREARFRLEDLSAPDVQARLRAIWTAPGSLDRSKQTAKVSKEIADELAAVARSYRGSGAPPEMIARFLMQCLFAMFAEDIGILPEESFINLLKRQRDHDDAFVTGELLQELFEKMNKGGVSASLGQKILQVNGGLYSKVEALPVNTIQRGLLINAAACDWKEVEPAIFGTLIEHALDPKERAKYGAHFTPREYVRRLVVPTVIEPLRADFENVRAAAYQLHDDGKDDEAFAVVADFHRTLCNTRVLDPACGSGNFLYVAMELMKELEVEVIELMDVFASKTARRELGFQEIDPSQFLGIESNPWAAQVAELVLWIGYLQQRYRNTGLMSWSSPVLRDVKNIQTRDAVLDYKEKVARVDADGEPVTRWNGITMRRHPATGEDVPDERATKQIYDYTEPKPAKTWPEAEFIIGNPPFIGASRMRERLDDGYVEALREAYPKLPESIDFVMYWWDRAANLARGYNAKTGKGLRRFGLITTNSFRQTFNRRVADGYLRDAKRPLSLVFAIPDHPWVDSEDGAAVRIAMTVGEKGRKSGRLLRVVEEHRAEDGSVEREVEFSEERGRIFANLRIGADVGGAVPLEANSELSYRGVIFGGSGFRVSKNAFFGSASQNIVRPISNGKDITKISRNEHVIDTALMSEDELRSNYPKAYQHLLDHLKPARMTNRRKAYRDRWWIYGEARPAMRAALEDLERSIITPMTAKHRMFVFNDNTVLPDQGLIVVALDSAEHLAVLSSNVHVLWSLARGGTLEDRPRYNNSVIFDPFPFPDLTTAQRTTLADLGERLDAHRKRVQADHPKLTVTDMYNVLEEFRAMEAAGEGEELEGKSLRIYEQGEIGTLRDLHDRIDAAVAEAYGWPGDLSDEDILQNLVDLNRQRAEEEARGHIRWLRPDFQNPEGRRPEESSGELDVEQAVVVELRPWPKTLPERMAAVRDVLAETGSATPGDVAAHIKGAGETKVVPFLDSLVATGLATRLEDGRYAA